ncbi:GDP-mannose 4,6-dehydratase [Paludibacterium yongneupense]|uniref:GDP-mannose 4,6-dehydratase n=1 Tax=Paludibacterium yongneupense TaxID=400061 RepID=UPI00056538E9|nr:GDP-mannose 4,6-dehydratase [Paludibacterium yongneupense]
MSKKTALICGVTGQDGAYLAKHLLDKGYEVWGSSRDAQLSTFSGLRGMGIFEHIRVLSISTVDFRSVLQALIKVKPDEIYNLAAQSSVGLSFEQPVETMESISLGVLNILEAIRFVNPSIRFYNAGSSEVFGDTAGVPADEDTPFRPRSPYAVAKAAATWQVSVYRDSYGLFACSGILFNHESPLRPERYVTRKIVSTACRIARGSGEKLRLGNIEISRDWGWAPEYVDAMWRMLNHSEPEDFVVATGQTSSLKTFISATFTELGLNWQDHVEYDKDLIRPSEIMVGSANPIKAEKLLGWKAENLMGDVIKMMVRHELTL